VTTHVYWHPWAEPSEDLRVAQVYGFLLQKDRTVLLQLDGDRYNLPGGKPEPDDTDQVATLIRECWEESQVEIGNPRYLGYVEVSIPGERYAQVRYVADVVRLLPVAPDPATHRVYRRVFLPVDQVAGCLDWGVHGQAQVRTLSEAIDSRGPTATS
jgi:8-oxo-dGTP pyrophosphatase MutT (NUDIX family)